MTHIAYVPSTVFTFARDHAVYPECHYSYVSARAYTNADWPVAIIPYTEYSDYSGGSVERSNSRILFQNSNIRPHLIYLYGHHGARGLAYSALTGPVSECPELAELVSALEKYPALDDEDVSLLESEIITEAWVDDGRRDFITFLNDRGYDLDIEVLGTAELLTKLWKLGQRHHGCEEVEEGGGVFFDFPQWGRQALTDPKIVATLARYLRKEEP